jgi:two-component system, OmpR family, response regulator MprA
MTQKGDQRVEKFRILLVDDDKTLRESIRRTLSKLPVEIREASNGFDGVAVATEWSPNLVISDLMMPCGTGVDLVETLRGNGSSVRIIIITGGTNVQAIADKVADLETAGEILLLEKPSGVLKIREITKGLLDKLLPLSTAKPENRSESLCVKT